MNCIPNCQDPRCKRKEQEEIKEAIDNKTPELKTRRSGFIRRLKTKRRYHDRRGETPPPSWSKEPPSITNDPHEAMAIKAIGALAQYPYAHAPDPQDIKMLAALFKEHLHYQTGKENYWKYEYDLLLKECNALDLQYKKEYDHMAFQLKK